MFVQIVEDMGKYEVTFQEVHVTRESREWPPLAYQLSDTIISVHLYMYTCTCMYRKYWKNKVVVLYPDPT